MNLPFGLLVRVFVPFACGYFLSYLYRVVNAVIAPDLIRDLQIDPSELGLLTSAYFIAFASSQLPLGVLLDRFGPRVVESFLLVIAAAGALIFAVSESLTGVVIGRAMIGFGVSACLMAALKGYVLWFHRDSWSRINGFHMAAGGLGVLTATTPVVWTLQITDWRGIFIGLSVLTFLVSMLVFFVVPEKKSVKTGENIKSQLQGIKQVFTSLTFWRVAPLATLTQAGYLSIQGLWAGPWIRDVSGMDAAQTARILSYTAIAMITGYISLGYLASKLASRNLSILAIAVLGMTLFITVNLLITLNTSINPAILWSLFGFFGSSGILTYTALTMYFPETLSGRVTTALNFMVFVAAFITQWAIGGIINLWEVNANGTYSITAYQAGFGTLLMLQVLGLLWFILSGIIKKRLEL